MNKSELVVMLRSKVFGDRGTDVQAAFDYVESVINGMSESSDRGPAWTAVHVLANTIANVIETLPEYVDRIEFLPEPPAVVRIAPEDNPAAGAPEREIERVTLVLDRESLNEIIDARISQSQAVTSVMTACLDETTSHFAAMITAAEKQTAARIEEISQQIDGKVTEGIDDFIANQLDDEIQKYMDQSVDFTEIVRDELKQNISFSIEVD